MSQPNNIGTIFVKHNAEIAHRLSLLEGKCQRIHGHSFHIKLTVHGIMDAQGICASIDFGSLKKLFRGYIDYEWDHHLHLNADDPWAQAFQLHDTINGHRLPGLITHPADPTTENVARWICERMWKELSSFSAVKAISIEIEETSTNGAKWVCARED